MNNNELGQVQAYLLRHRFIESKSARRNISREEKDFTALLNHADPSMRILLDEIFDGQGLFLHQFNYLDVPAVPTGWTAFALARKPDSAPPFFGNERLVSKMKNSGIKTDAEAKIWFLQIWYVHLELIYTRKNRSPSQMLMYVEAIFTREALADALRSYINDHVCKLDQTAIEDDAVYKTITSAKDGTIAQAINSFLDLMKEAALLERSGADDNTYRQTLLAAFEMKNNFDRQLATLMPHQDPVTAARVLLIEEED